MEKHFTHLSDRFCDRIYGTPKGQIRIQRVWQTLQQHLPQAPAHVLDMGGGAGHISEILCDTGYRVTLVEPVDNMLSLAKDRLAHYIEQGQAQCVQGSLHDDPANWISEDVANNTAFPGSRHASQFDVVVCHAVLEWLEQPQRAIPKLVETLAPGGYLSLLFYNRHSITIKNLLRGNFYRAKQALIDNQWGGEPGGLTPVSPLDPVQVRDWVAQAGLQKIGLFGIRSFYDYMPKAVSSKRSLEDVLELEQLVSDAEPFLYMSRYLHLIAKKPG